MIADDIMKSLAADPDGLLTYEYIANHINVLSPDDMTALADNMIQVDRNGQFVVSAARYLSATDRELFAEPIARLIAAAIDKDRERRYLGDLLQAIYGPDYAERAGELSAADDNFRRIYKRLYSNSPL
ncbi:hypothetical protein ED551_00735 [Muribaculaceae bacterium Isolate-013 (NCI)]|nr:hypothetical protein ED551_00735 [Muribaculaceae bacterium Isolate-013 (NCI)]